VQYWLVCTLKSINGTLGSHLEPVEWRQLTNKTPRKITISEWGLVFCQKWHISSKFLVIKGSEIPHDDGSKNLNPFSSYSLPLEVVAIMMVITMRRQQVWLLL